jgi:NADP-dependent 3-hydroxy acid dehydrogenase YdfG
MKNLSNATAVVTGGAMGIGLATVKRLLAEGVTVTIWDLSSEALESAKKELAGLGKVFYHQCDVTDKVRVYELGKIAFEEMSNVDILVNNAGYVRGGYFHERPDDEWEKTIDVNLTSFIYTTKAFLPAMYEKNRGHVVNISSAAGTIGVPGLAIYAATKWAVWGLTESLRFEAKNLGKKGVKFSSIHPSYIRTGMFEGAKIPFPGGLIVPLLKSHDVIAKAIVEAAIKKGRLSPKRPLTVHLTPRLRLLPDSWFQWLLGFLKITESMSTFKGRK